MKYFIVIFYLLTLPLYITFLIYIISELTITSILFGMLVSILYGIVTDIIMEIDNY